MGGGGVVDLVSRKIKNLRVDHLSFDESVPEESLSAYFFH